MISRLKRIFFIVLLTLVGVSSSSLAESEIKEEVFPVIIGDPVIIIDESQEGYEPEVYTEEELKVLREELGVQDISAPDQNYLAYNFRGEGFFVISKENFSDLDSARKFCDHGEGFEVLGGGADFDIVDPYIALGLTFMGLPFSSLLDTSVMNKPVIDFEGLRTGVIFWTTSELNQIGENIVYAFTDGNGAGAGAYQSVEELNKRLLENESKPVNMPVVCVDENLKKFLNDPPPQDSEIIEIR